MSFATAGAAVVALGAMKAGQGALHVHDAARRRTQATVANALGTPAPPGQVPLRHVARGEPSVLMSTGRVALGGRQGLAGTTRASCGGQEEPSARAQSAVTAPRSSKLQSGGSSPRPGRRGLSGPSDESAGSARPLPSASRPGHSHRGHNRPCSWRWCGVTSGRRDCRHRHPQSRPGSPRRHVSSAPSEAAAREAAVAFGTALLRRRRRAALPHPG